MPYLNSNNADKSRNRGRTFLVCCALVAFIIYAFQRPTDDPKTEAALGERLFYDKILSEDYSLSCASCHRPEFAFADTVAVSIGVHGRKGTRNAPSVMNVLARETLFWDGRALTLAEQAIAPIENEDEMNLPIEEAIQRLRASPKYGKWFGQIFNELPNAENIGRAIAAFEKTLETGDAPNDRWVNGDDDAMSESAIRGRQIFREKGKCFECHFTPDFTGDEFKNIGLFNGRDLNDSGRIRVTQQPEDLGRFKVPGLRNVELTAPYMHNGMFKTLREVIDFYNDPKSVIPDAINTDSLLQQPLHLTEQEKIDLEQFLLALTSDFLKS